MKAIFLLVAAEFGRLVRRPLTLVALVLLLAVPAGYTGLLIWVNHDPYSDMSRIPAALVVSDVGAKVGNVTVNYGDRVAQKVVTARKFDWHRVSPAQAATGLKNGTYDFSIGMPAEFSAKVASTVQNTPGVKSQKATLLLTTNDATSYAATTVAKQAANTIADALAQEIRVASATGLLTQLDVVRSGLVTVVDGSAELSSALTKIGDGSQHLALGAGQLRDGAGRLDAGLSILKRATSSLSVTAAELSAAAQTVAIGSSTLAAAGQRAVAVADADLSPASIAVARAALIADLEKAGLTPAQLSLVTAHLDTLAADAAGVNAQVHTISTQLDLLSGGAARVSGGVQKLSAEAPTLLVGVARSAAGASELAAGSREVSAGSQSVAAAIDETSGTASTIHDSLAEGLAKIAAASIAERSNRAHTMARPVAVRAEALTTAGSLGAGLAPYFISLGAWIGIYALFLMIRPPELPAGSAVRRRLTGFLPGWITASLLGSLQMAAVLAIVTVALKVRVDQPAATIAFMVLTSATFAAIMWTLNILLGRIGPFVGLGLMLVQLVTAGGTFPWQTLPGPLMFLHTAMPMSAAVDGLRQLIYGGSLSIAGADARELAGWLIGSLVVAVLATHRRTATGAVAAALPQTFPAAAIPRSSVAIAVSNPHFSDSLN